MVGALVEQELMRDIRAVRAIFERYFDRSWLALLIDGLPLDGRTMREIRALLALTTLYPGDELEIARGVEQLEHFVATLHRCLLPTIKERLMVSGLRGTRAIRDQNQYILRRCVAITFPHNLQLLTELTVRLRRSLDRHFPPPPAAASA